MGREKGGQEKKERVNKMIRPDKRIIRIYKEKG